MDLVIEVDLRTQITFVNGEAISGRCIEPDHWIFDVITPYQASKVFYEMGLRDAANDAQLIK